MNLSSSLASLLEFRLTLKELASADLSDRRSQRGDSGNTPGMLQGGGTKRTGGINEVGGHRLSHLSAATTARSRESRTHAPVTEEECERGGTGAQQAPPGLTAQDHSQEQQLPG